MPENLFTSYETLDFDILKYLLFLKEFNEENLINHYFPGHVRYLQSKYRHDGKRN